jgi:multicomponent Na+:H+ antiporter subunit D
MAILTMLTGGLGAIGVSDIRRMLGYWVITGIGVMLTGLALGGSQAVGASLFYMLHSMVVMAGLYFLAGLIGRACGSFDLARLGGLYRLSPFLAAVALTLLFAVSGLPPFSGFWPKAILVRIALGRDAWWLAAALLISGLLITIAAARIFLLAFWRAAASEGGVAKLPRLQVTVVASLAVLSLALGLWPGPAAAISARAAHDLIDPEGYIRSVFTELQP